jgi:hypothetical protein
MNNAYNKVKSYLLELGYQVSREHPADGILIVNHESAGIKNLVLAVADPILILEQFLFEIKQDVPEIFRSLLIKNRDIVHGAFVLDESGQKVLFRDTLELEYLNANELEGTIDSLSLLLSEYSDELIHFARY